MSETELSKGLLRAALADAGLTGAQLADLLQVDQRTARRWLAGRVPYSSHRLQIAKALGKHVSDIWPQLATRAPAGERFGDLEGAWAHWSQHGAPDWSELITAAHSTIELCDFTLRGVLETPGAPELLAAKAASGARVRLMIASLEPIAFSPRDWPPDAGQTRARDGALFAAVAQSHKRLFALDADTRVEASQVLMPRCPLILRFDQQMLVALPLSGMPRGDPVLHLRHRSEDGLFAAFCAYFETLWQTGRPLDGNPTPPASAPLTAYESRDDDPELLPQPKLSPYGRRPPRRRGMAVAGAR